MFGGLFSTNKTKTILDNEIIINNDNFEIDDLKFFHSNIDCTTNLMKYTTTKISNNILSIFINTLKTKINDVLLFNKDEGKNEEIYVLYRDNMTQFLKNDFMVVYKNKVIHKCFVSQLNNKNLNISFDFNNPEIQYLSLIKLNIKIFYNDDINVTDDLIDYVNLTPLDITIDISTCINNSIKQYLFSKNCYVKQLNDRYVSKGIYMPDFNYLNIFILNKNICKFNSYELNGNVATKYINSGLLNQISFIHLFQTISRHSLKIKQSQLDLIENKTKMDELNNNINSIKKSINNRTKYIDYSGEINYLIYENEIVKKKCDELTYKIYALWTMIAVLILYIFNN